MSHKISSKALEFVISNEKRGRTRRGVKKGQKIDLTKVVIGSTYENRAA